MSHTAGLSHPAVGLRLFLLNPADGHLESRVLQANRLDLALADVESSSTAW